MAKSVQGLYSMAVRLFIHFRTLPDLTIKVNVSIIKKVSTLFLNRLRIFMHYTYLMVDGWNELRGCSLVFAPVAASRGGGCACVGRTRVMRGNLTALSKYKCTNSIITIFRIPDNAYTTLLTYIHNIHLIHLIQDLNPKQRHRLYTLLAGDIKYTIILCHINYWIVADTNH